MTPVGGGLVVCGATSDAGKSWVVAGLCRLLARRGVRVAPFKAQNMALNAAVTADGAEIGHAQWVQAVAAGVEPEAAMNPVLLKPTGERTSQVVVLGQARGVMSAAEYHDEKVGLRSVVLDALADLRRRFDVVLCEGAGGAAEINLLDRDLANLPLAAAAGLPAVVVGDIERGGVFASLYGTVALLPDHLRPLVRGFVINRFRGDPALLLDGCDELERRSGVPTLGVVPLVAGTDLDAEDSLALDRWGTVGVAPGSVLDVAAVRLPRVANFGDLDPLRLEPSVTVRWVRSPAELGRPHLVVLPGSKATGDDLAWLRATGLADALVASDVPVVAVCAGAQMVGARIDDPDGVEGMPGSVDGLGRLDLRTTFAAAKVLDRPAGSAVGGPGAGERVAGYRIHHGRVAAGDGVAPWLVADDGTVLGWRSDRVLATTLHGLFEADGLRAAVLRWAAERAGLPAPDVPAVDFAAARTARLDRMADALEASLDLDRLLALVAEGAPAPRPPTPSRAPGDVLGPVAELVPFMRWRVGEPAPDDLVGADLATDPDRLAALVAPGVDAWRTDDPQVLASLWWQSYSYRLAGTTLAAWVLTGGAPDPAAPGAGTGRRGPRSSSLLVGPTSAVVEDLDDLLFRLFAGHLDGVAAALRARHRIGEQLLWGNTAAAVASALGALATAEGAPALRARVDAVTAALPHRIDALGTWAPGAYDFRRRTCCLWWKTAAADGATCEDCSLRTHQEAIAP